jgi:hypothetical protein
MASGRANLGRSISRACGTRRRICEIVKSAQGRQLIPALEGTGKYAYSQRWKGLRNKTVNPIVISWLVFACVFGGVLLGMLLRRVLPEHHLSTDSKDVVKLGMGLIGTMAALVLALLIASAKSSFDTQSNEVMEMSADFMLLDRTLAHYGAEAKEARDRIPITVAKVLDQTWSEDTYRSDKLDGAISAGAETFYEKIQEIDPRSDFQRAIYSQALQISLELGRKRALLLEQTGASISVPFLVVLVFWLAIIFTSFGLFAPGNSTVIGVLFVCALSVAGAIFLILELDQPIHGLIQISSVPLRQALTHLGR